MISPADVPRAASGPGGDFIAAGAPVDLTNCDREPINIPGSVQPHGVLVAVDEKDLSVVQVSANCADLFGVVPESVVGRTLAELLGHRTVQGIVDVVETSYDLREASPVDVAVEVGGETTTYDAILHRSNGLVIIEVQLSRGPRPITFVATYQQTRTSVLRLNRATSLSELYEVATEEVRRLTGFDRVMVYRFDAEWNGEVVAESRRADLNSFLGLHYPATDIPSQARALYERSWLRLIPDVGYQSVPVIPTNSPVTGDPLDMSDAWLRSVSPIHLEYLGNMGVTASMSVSLLEGHRLWGLIACHHYSGPHQPSYEICAAAEFLGHLLSVRLVARQEGQDLERTLAARVVLDQLAAVGDPDDPPQPATLVEGRPSLLDLVSAGGVAAVIEGTYITAGTVPPRDVLRAIFSRLETSDDVVAVDTIAPLGPEFAAVKDVVSGMLAFRLSDDEAIIWVRPETLRTVDWGGDPLNKQIAASESGEIRLSPRRSFDRWRDTIQLRAEAWSPTDVELATELRRRLLRVLYGRARRTAQLAETVQHSLLPDHLASVTGYDIDAQYRSSAGGSVGGDWYDGFLLPSGELALVIGDVAGHGLAAAAAMGQLRNALRAYLSEIVPGDPDGAARALARLDRMMSLLLPEQFATAIIAVVEPATGVTRIASSGHPPPLHVTATPGGATSVGATSVDGRGRAADFVDLAAAPPLGALTYAPVGPSGAGPVATVTLRPGDALVLYSDGLVERRYEAPETGLARIRARACVDGADDSAAALATALFEDCRDPMTSDDTTVLVLRRLP